MRLPPTIPFPHPKTYVSPPTSIPEVLGRTLGPPLPRVSAHPVPSILLVSICHCGPDHPAPKCQSPGIARGPAGLFRVVLGRRAMRLRPRATPSEREMEELQSGGRKEARKEGGKVTAKSVDYGGVGGWVVVVRARH